MTIILDDNNNNNTVMTIAEITVEMVIFVMIAIKSRWLSIVRMKVLTETYTSNTKTKKIKHNIIIIQ